MNRETYPPEAIAAMQQQIASHTPQPTQIPVEAVDADQLPTEKGWTYEEFAQIVGGLYLDSYRRSALMDDQFKAIAQEYESTVMRLRSDIERLEQDNKELRNRVSDLSTELEARNRGIKSRTTSASSDDGSHTLPSNG